MHPDWGRCWLSGNLHTTYARLHSDWVHLQCCCCCWVPEMVIMSSLARMGWSKRRAATIKLQACTPSVQFGGTDRQTDRQNLQCLSNKKCCHSTRALQSNNVWDIRLLSRKIGGKCQINARGEQQDVQSRLERKHEKPNRRRRWTAWARSSRRQTEQDTIDEVNGWQKAGMRRGTWPKAKPTVQWNKKPSCH